MTVLRSIPAPAEALLGSSALAHLVTRNRDGSPQVSVVWCGVRGDQVFFCAEGSTAKIRNILRDGAVVLSDRYDLSSLAYQSASARGADPAETIAWIRSLNRHARRPDVTIVLDVSPEVAEARRRSRGGSAELYDDEGLQARLAAAYRTAESLVPGDVVLHVDGDAPADEVTAAVIAALAPHVEHR